MKLMYLFAGLLAAGIFGCSKELAGPCFQAMQYQREAQQESDEVRKAVLLGKADAAQRECDSRGKLTEEAQARDARARQR